MAPNKVLAEVFSDGKDALQNNNSEFLEFGSEAQAAGIESVLVSYFVRER
jgi:hypothetical protein